MPEQTPVPRSSAVTLFDAPLSRRLGTTPPEGPSVPQAYPVIARRHAQMIDAPAEPLTDDSAPTTITPRHAARTVSAPPNDATVNERPRTAPPTSPTVTDRPRVQTPGGVSTTRRPSTPPPSPPRFAKPSVSPLPRSQFDDAEPTMLVPPITPRPRAHRMPPQRALQRPGYRSAEHKRTRVYTLLALVTGVLAPIAWMHATDRLEAGSRPTLWLRAELMVGAGMTFLATAVISCGLTMLAVRA